ncbi:MAG: DUF5337 domain-containing protein [Rubellimicrobium sp.]|nr:DUF5337 domain-containing protein [Rubellimicrobium sp.]
MADRPGSHGPSGDAARAGRRPMVVLIVTAVTWILAIEIGSQYDWPVRLRVLVDLMALAGFALGLWMTYQLWRRRRNDKG